MAKWLTAEWMDMVKGMAQSQPERPGATARMQYVITESPDGDDVHYYWIIEDGKLIECALGDVPDEEFTMTMTMADHKKIQMSELDPNTAFMSGRIKVTGNMAKLMGLLPITNSDEYKQLQVDIAAATEF